MAISLRPANTGLASDVTFSLFRQARMGRGLKWAGSSESTRALHKITTITEATKQPQY